MRVLLPIAFVSFASAASPHQPTKLDVDDLLGLSKSELARHIPQLNKSVQVPDWKGFKLAVFGFNVSNKLYALHLYFQKPLTEPEALAALESVFKLKLDPAKALPYNAGRGRFADVSPEIKAVTFTVVQKYNFPRSDDKLGSAVVISHLDYND